MKDGNPSLALTIIEIGLQMTATAILSPLKFCKKCQCETKRYKGDRCKPCSDAKAELWRSRNPEKSKQIRAFYVAANPEKQRAFSKKWRHENPEAIRIKSQNRRARQRIVGGKLSKGLTERLFKLQCGKCACCGLSLGYNYHLDHIMPLALGGSDWPSNLQCLCPSCNMSKNAKDPIMWANENGRLL